MQLHHLNFKNFRTYIKRVMSTGQVKMIMLICNDPFSLFVHTLLLFFKENVSYITDFIRELLIISRSIPVSSFYRLQM